ncbi:MAG: hypothetical protein GXX78_15440, partial [Bacteroidales bacterium]|nr:hypothetical protein [Bacteroidales bacterium]
MNRGLKKILSWLVLPVSSGEMKANNSFIPSKANFHRSIKTKTLIIAILISTTVYSQNSATFITSGTFVVPPGVTQITVQAWGGGGRGGTGNGAGGGGGGAYSSSLLNVTPGTNYTVTVGAGSTNNQPGGDSWFGSTSTLLAKGGHTAQNNSNGANGGQASAGVGDTKYSGGNGGDGYNFFVNPGGGGGGSAFVDGNGNNGEDAGVVWLIIVPIETPGEGGTGTGNGGNGANTNNNNAQPGSQPGGGGGGRSNTGNPGSGANGQIIITWSSCTPPAAPTAGSNSPICAGSTLTLTASTISGATYSWTGPNGFTSSAQNPNITNATIAATGTYSVTATVSGCTSSAGTTSVTVVPQPTAPPITRNPDVNNVCAGQTLTATTSAGSGGTGTIADQ